MKLSIHLKSLNQNKMRNYFYLLFVLLSAPFVQASETIPVTGKITNGSGMLKIIGESFEREVQLKPDGTFALSLTIDYAGSYFILTGNNRAAIYLAKGTSLTITADNNDFYKTLKFGGKGSMENQYITSKNAYVNAINQEWLYTKNEADFLKEVDAIKKDILLLFENGKFPAGYYREMELKNIDYLKQVFILNYEKNHAHFAKLPDFKVSDSFPKRDSKINLDNEKDFLFSNPYKQLVNINFNETVEKQLKPDDQYLWKIALPEIKKVKSPSIKNALLYALSYEVSASNPDAQTLYNELLATSTNPIFKKEITAKYDKLKALSAGTLSPAFDYENHKGGKTSLESLKGKYVYIDVWATWCGPCLRELPALQKVEETYEGKNIEFVSLSVDTKKDYEKWKKMVTDKQMGGIQIIADNDWNSQFAIDYAIVSIPRFILLDPQGKIVSADAPRPSDPELPKLLSTLNL